MPRASCPAGTRRRRCRGSPMWWCSRGRGGKCRAIGWSPGSWKSRRSPCRPPTFARGCARAARYAISCPTPCGSTSRRPGCIANRGTMLKTLVTKITGTRFTRELKRIRPLVNASHRHEEQLKAASDDVLKAQTQKFRGWLAERVGELAGDVERLKQEKHDCPDAAERVTLGQQLTRAQKAYRTALQAALDELLPEAFATVREACRRLVGSKVVVTSHEQSWDMVPYDVQLIGGIVLHQGKRSEEHTP